MTALFLPFGMKAQVQMVNDNGVAQMQKVIEVTGQSALDLYKLTYKWVDVAFKNPDEVLEGQLEGELLRGRGSSSVDLPGLVPVPTRYMFNFAIEFKDGRLRITLDNFMIGTGPQYSIESYLYKASGEERTNAQARGIKKDIVGDMNALIASLEQHLVNGGTEDDW